jgi:hypothetical protein
LQKVIKAGFSAKPKNVQMALKRPFCVFNLFYRPSVGLCEAGFVHSFEPRYDQSKDMTALQASFRTLFLA